MAVSEQPPPGLTVLVVDDVSDIRLSCRFMLETGGFRVLDAPDVRNALRCLDREKVDVLLTDLYMPLDSGSGLIARLRQDDRFSTMQLGVCSGSDAVEDRERALAAGADFYLEKPLDFARIIGNR